MESINHYLEQLLPDYQPKAKKIMITRNEDFPGAESKIWQAHPVWVIDGGFSQLKGCLRLLFWSGQSFDEAGLKPEGSFNAPEVWYTHIDQLQERDLARWIEKAQNIQSGSKNIVKRKGVLEALEGISQS